MSINSDGHWGTEGNKSALGHVLSDDTHDGYQDLQRDHDGYQDLQMHPRLTSQGDING